jgi:hypothetical protein
MEYSTKEPPYIIYILAPSIPPLRGEEKDKLLIWEGVGGGVLVPHNIGNCCIYYSIYK